MVWRDSHSQTILKSLVLRSFHRFAVRSSSAHEGKIIIFEKYSIFLDKNYTVKLTIGKINRKD